MEEFLICFEVYGMLLLLMHIMQCNFKVEESIKHAMSRLSQHLESWACEYSRDNLVIDEMMLLRPVFSTTYLIALMESREGT